MTSLLKNKIVAIFFILIVLVLAGAYFFKKNPIYNPLTFFASKIPTVNFSKGDLVIKSKDWHLNGFDFTTEKDIVIYSAYQPATERYVIFRFDVAPNSSIPIKEFRISNKHFTFSTRVGQFDGPRDFLIPRANIQISPDNTRFWWRTPKSKWPVENSFILDLEGKNERIVSLPENLAQFYWFSNNELAFGGATYGGAPYNYPYIQIYDINTGKISSTKIPTRGAFSGLEPKVNPASTAYAYSDMTSNSGGYDCGSNIVRLTVKSYPEGEELYRLEDLHYVHYRWLTDGGLEISYQRALDARDKEVDVSCLSEEKEILNF